MAAIVIACVVIGVLLLAVVATSVGKQISDEQQRQEDCIAYRQPFDPPC